VAAGWHGRAGPGVAGRWLTVRREKDPGAIANKTLSWKRCLANRADDVAAQDDPRTPPRRCEINVLAGTRGLATRTPRSIGLSRSPQITPPGVMPGWCAQRPGAATFDDSDNRIPAAAEPGKPARTRNQAKIRARGSLSDLMQSLVGMTRHDGEEQVLDRSQAVQRPARSGSHG
jgi:hypothetical protein